MSPAKHRTRIFVLAGLGAGLLSAAGVLAADNPWRFDADFRDATGLCAIERRLDGVGIKYTRQADLDAGLTVSFDQNSAVAPASTAKITYAGGMARSHDVIMPGPGIFTLLPGSADGFFTAFTQNAGGFDIALGAQVLRVDAASAADMILSLAECQGTTPTTPRPLITPPLAVADAAEEAPPEMAPLEAPAAFLATTPAAAVPKAVPVPAPAPKAPAVKITPPSVSAQQPAPVPPAEKPLPTDIQDVIRSWAKTPAEAPPETPGTAPAPTPEIAEAPPAEKPGLPRHRLSEDDGGLERALLEEWSEKIGLLEKENIALRQKSGGADARLGDIRQDPMAQIREEALRKKVLALQEELEKTKTEAQKALSDVAEKIAAEPPPLPPDEDASTEIIADLPAVSDAPEKAPATEPKVPGVSFGPPVPAYGPPAPPPGSAEVESAIPFPSSAESLQGPPAAPIQQPAE